MLLEAVIEQHVVIIWLRLRWDRDDSAMKITLYYHCSHVRGTALSIQRKGKVTKVVYIRNHSGNLQFHCLV